MAWVDVAADKADFSTDTTTFTAPLPTTGSNNIQPGDVILYTVTTTSLTATTLTPVSSSGSLFASGVGSSDACQSQGWYFVVGSSVPSSLVVNLAAARQGTLAWFAYRGADTTNPLDASPVATAQNSASSATPVMPSITTVTPGALIVGGLCHGSGSTTVTAFPSGWTQVVDGTRRNGMLFKKGIQAVAGPSGTGTFTLSSTQQNRIWTAALRPAPAPTDPPIQATLTSQPYPGFTGDVADGAAIVYDQASPGSSVVITTNKDTGGGLYVLGLDGQIKSSSLPGAANSVDWRDLTGVAGWDDRILVMTSDRQANALRYYWLDRTTKALTPAGTTSLAWEPYGTCLYRHSDGQVYAFVTQRGPDDTSARNMYQYPLARSGETVSAGAVARTIALSSVVEGLAADDVTGYLFASEEDVGLFRYSASPSGGSARTTVDTVGGGNLVADVEDVAVARTSEGAWLLVSSQGDSSYHVYNLATLAHEQRFTVVRPDGVDQVTSTDGLDVYLGDFGGDFPNGLVVVHDGDKTPTSDFAFVDAGLVFGDLPAESLPAAGVVAAVSSTTGAVAARRPAAAVLALSSAAVGQVVAQHNVTGAVSTVSGVTGAPVAVLTAAGMVAAASSVAGVLDGQTDVTGTVAVTSSTAGAVTALHTIAGTVAVTTTATGSAASQHVLAGSVQAVSGAAGTVTSESGSTNWPAVGTVTTITTAAGTVLAAHALAGAAPAVTTVAGDLDARLTIAGTIAAATATSGNATVSGSPSDHELILGRGPYGHPFQAGSPRGNPLAVSSPRR